MAVPIHALANAAAAMPASPPSASDPLPTCGRLTRLPTRPALHDLLSALLATWQPGTPSPVPLALDLDRFQAVDDSARHADVTILHLHQVDRRSCAE